MKLIDFSPATSPTLDQQRDALRKGLGRAMIWAKNGHLDEAILLDACLHDWRFELSVEEYRGDWLWQIMQAARVEDRFRAAVFEALNNLVEDDAFQLCQLAYHYAANGDEAFRQRLYKIVQEKPFAELRYLGEEGIIRLDGANALLFTIKLRGSQLENRDWEWDDSVLMYESIERLGEDRVMQLRESVLDPDSRRFWDTWSKNKADSEEEKNSRPSHSDEMKLIPVAEVILAAQSSEANFPYFRGWGRWADDDALNTVFEHLLAARELKVIANYLKVFSGREFPHIVPELVSLSQHNDPEIRRRAISALENSSHPLVRELAESELSKGLPDGLALGLFVKNYQDGDEQRIIELAEIPKDANQQHWLFQDAVKILEENPKAECSQLAVVIYALNPCCFCRYYAAKLLRDRQVAPAWLIEECRFDAEPDTQKLFLEP
jgi:hypothetical protein